VRYGSDLLDDVAAMNETERADFAASVEAYRAASAESARKWARRGQRSFAIGFWSFVGLFTNVEHFVPAVPYGGVVIFVVATCCWADALWCWEHWRFDKAVAGR
jgi:hypothetical protein